VLEMTEGYDMGSAEIPDPVAFGWNVADFDIGDRGPDPCDMTKTVEPAGGGRPLPDDDSLLVTSGVLG
jgi:hypothetical protein